MRISPFFFFFATAFIFNNSWRLKNSKIDMNQWNPTYAEIEYLRCLRFIQQRTITVKLTKRLKIRDAPIWTCQCSLYFLWGSNDFLYFNWFFGDVWMERFVLLMKSLQTINDKWRHSLDKHTPHEVRSHHSKKLMSIKLLYSFSAVIYLTPFVNLKWKTLVIFPYKFLILHFLFF